MNYGEEKACFQVGKPAQTTGETLLSAVMETFKWLILFTANHKTESPVLKSHPFVWYAYHNVFSKWQSSELCYEFLHSQAESLESFPSVSWDPFQRFPQKEKIKLKRNGK